MVTKNGHKAFTEELDLKRDERRTVKVQLDFQDNASSLIRFSFRGRCSGGGVSRSLRSSVQGNAKRL